MKLNLDNWLNELFYSHSIFDTNIMRARQVKYLRLADQYRLAKMPLDEFIKLEFTIEAIYKKIVTLVVCCYMTSTELRIKQTKEYEQLLIAMGSEKDMAKRGLKKPQDMTKPSRENPMPES